MNDRPEVDPLFCLFQTLLGAVLGIYSAFEYVEKSFGGKIPSFLWAILALTCARMVYNGLQGLLERPSLQDRSWLAVIGLAMVAGLIGPGMSDQRQRAYEAATWEEVKDSKNAILWQNRYTKRVPEVYRHSGWESRYTLAVCAYSIQSKEYTSLDWYAREAFREHPSKYDDLARSAIQAAFTEIFRNSVSRIQEQKLGDPKFLGQFQSVLSRVSKSPQISVLWKVDFEGELPDSVREGATQEFDSLLFGRLNRELGKHFPGGLLRMVTPAAQSDTGDKNDKSGRKGKPGDLMAQVRVQVLEKSGYHWTLQIGDENGQLLDFQWVDPKPPTSKDLLANLRNSARGFSEVIVDKLGLKALPEPIH